VREADVVTANGELFRVSAYEHPDLFWGIKGSGGNFGIVTSTEFALYPLTTVYGGNLFYSLEQTAEVLDLYSRWVETLPEEMATAIAFMNFPPLPMIPEPLCGGSFVSVRGCYCENPPEAGEELLGSWHEFGEPLVDTFRVMSYREMDMISMDPVDPIGAYTHVELLGELSPEAITKLVEVAGGGLELAADPARASPPRRRPRASSRRPEPHRAPQRQVYYGRGRGYAYPEVAQAVQAHLAYVAEEMRPYETGATYVNFLEFDGATPERVRAAYSSEDWEHLVGLKNRYDPANLFRFNRNSPPS
jgi:FAD/FMN-containing dehydrogenase